MTQCQSLECRWTTCYHQHPEGRTDEEEEQRETSSDQKSDRNFFFIFVSTVSLYLYFLFVLSYLSFFETAEVVSGVTLSDESGRKALKRFPLYTIGHKRNTTKVELSRVVLSCVAWVCECVLLVGSYSSSSSSSVGTRVSWPTVSQSRRPLFLQCTRRGGRRRRVAAPFLYLFKFLIWQLFPFSSFFLLLGRH